MKPGSRVRAREMYPRVPLYVDCFDGTEVATEVISGRREVLLVLDVQPVAAILPENRVQVRVLTPDGKTGWSMFASFVEVS